MKLQESKGRYHITIPAKIVESLEYTKGKQFIIKIGKNNSIILEPSE